MNQWLSKASANPRTSAMGVFQVLIGAVALWGQRQDLIARIVSGQITDPHTLPAVALLITGLTALFGADAKEEIKAKEVTPETTVVVDKP